MYKWKVIQLDHTIAHLIEHKLNELMLDDYEVVNVAIVPRDDGQAIEQRTIIIMRKENHEKVKY